MSKQFEADVQALRVGDDWCDLLDEVNNNIVELLQNEMFTTLDPDILRAHFRTNIEEYREEKKRVNEEGGSTGVQLWGQMGCHAI